MENQTTKKSLLSWITEYSASKKNYYISSVILAFLGVICSLVPYYFTGRIIEKLINGVNQFSGYQMDIINIFIFWTLRIIFHSFSTALSHKATFTVLANIRKALLIKLMKVPLGDVMSISSGSLKNIIVERVDSMETTLAHIVPEFTANLAAPFLLFIYICTISWKLALASLITLPVAFLCMAAVMKDSAERWENCVVKTKNLNDTAVEYINGIEVIKAFGKSESSYESFTKAAKEGAYCFIDWMKATIIYFTAAMAIAPATLLAVIPVGGIMYLNGHLAATEFIVVIILAMSLMTPLITVMSYGDDLTKANTIFEEIDDILKMKELSRPMQSLDYPKDTSISLKDIHFSYLKDKEILHGIDIEIKPNTVNAFVGPSGSGKSTIARLIASLWDADSGIIEIGGVNIKNMSLEDYNQQIAYVSQNNYLFNTTIRENIRMGNKNAGDEEVEEAAKKCGCHEFIMNLENGYETLVGNSGGHLSGGERQRVSIARAMLKDAPIIILDEATAYTDPENEALIQRSLARITSGKTLIVIAHRLSTIRDASQIIVVNNGQVDSRGTHEELLAMNGLYKKMWLAHIDGKDSDEEVYHD